MAQAIPYEMGPYYLPKAVTKLQQEAALTGKAVPAQTLAQLAYGGEMAAYQEATGRQKTAFEQNLATEKLGLEKERVGFEEERVGYEGKRVDLEEERNKLAWSAEERAEEQAKSQERADIVKGVAAIPAAYAVTSAATEAAFALTAAETGAALWTFISEAVVSLLACCFTFDAGNLLTENVRKYRDEHYNKHTSPISFGYRWMSKWIVPLMKNHKSILFLTRFLMLKPLALYADWYYGDNYYGWIFYPQKAFFTNAWKVIGLIVDPETLFVKEVM